MITAIRRWHRYRRTLNRSVNAKLDMGYNISLPAYQQMREQARRETLTAYLDAIGAEPLDPAGLAALRANNLWATGQKVTRRTRRRLRREARRDLTP